MISLTDNAVRYVKSRLKAGDVLRVGIDVTGISGVHPSLKIDELYQHLSSESKELYELYEILGVTVVVDKKYSKYIEGMVIDYYEGLDRSGFVLRRSEVSSV